jgi:hypothetical protein
VWLLVGWTVGAGRRAIVGTFSAAVVASLVDALAFVLRLAMMSLPFGIDPGDFNLDSLLASSWFPNWLGKVSPVWIWWALVLAGGLARSWLRPLSLVVPVVLIATGGWVMFPSFWHMILH